MSVVKASDAAECRAVDPDVELFATADWHLTDSPRRRTADVHPYPARFIPELPALALQVLRPNGPVIDPFCGSGTTLVEAMRRGHDAIGVDINPIACLISRVKTTPWRPADEPLLERHARALLTRATSGDAAVQRALCDEIPRVDHWFESWAQRLLAGAVSYVRDLDDCDPWRDRVALAVSAATVRIGRQESDTRYAAVAKTIGPEGGLKAVEVTLRRLAAWLVANRDAVEDNAARVICGDSRQLSELADGSAAAAVFSPPYPNAYEYWLYHKYRMYWLGFDPIGVREAELGARPHYCKPNGLTADDFEGQMFDVFKELHRVLRPNGSAVVIVGDSQIRGEEVNNADVLCRSSAQAGFEVLASTFRAIRKSSTSFNQQHSRARTGEHVLLFSRRG